jgi:hypothetical protein
MVKTKTGWRAKGTNNEMPGLGSGPVNRGWLFVVTGAVLISPYAARQGGPNDEETGAILDMQPKLRDHALTVSIDPETGWVEAHSISADELNRAASRSATVRLRRYGAAA